MAIPQLKLSDIARAHPKQRLSCQKLKERPNLSLSKAKLFTKFYVTSSGQWHTCWKEACHLKSHCGVFLVFFLSTQCYRSLEEGMATTSGILVWRIPMDRGVWQATVHGIAKSWHDWETKDCTMFQTGTVHRFQSPWQTKPPYSPIVNIERKGEINLCFCKPAEFVALCYHSL